MAAKEETQPVEVKFDLVVPQKRPILFVSGAWGGINAQGQVIAHLYFEYPSHAKEASVRISSDGEVVKQEMGPKPQNPYVREVQASIVLEPTVAEAFANWLIGEAKRSVEARS